MRQALRKLKGAGRKADDLIFKAMFPGYKRFYKDLEAAGIDWQDTGEGRLDFHSFRVTYCTQLAPGTPSERVRMALMRHRDPKQTAKTYTDARMLPLKDAIGKLNFHRVESTTAGDSQRDSQTPVASGHFVSSSVTLPMLADSEKIARSTREKSLFVTASQNGSKDGKWSERQDLNLSCSHIFPAARLRR